LTDAESSGPSGVRIQLTFGGLLAYTSAAEVNYATNAKILKRLAAVCETLGIFKKYNHL